MDQNNPQHETHISAEKARAGETPHITRWVLGISLTLTVIALSAVWIIPSLTQGDRTVDDPAETFEQPDTRPADGAR